MNGSSCYFSDTLVLHVLSSVTVRGGKAREVMCRCERIQFDDLSSIKYQPSIANSGVYSLHQAIRFLGFVSYFCFTS